jgi:DNA-binding winged helix-turn-helix (wHTH) protein/Tol biopolymer transport system component
MSRERQKFEFDDFLLDAKEKMLLRGGRPLSITPKAFELLLVLVENQGHLVEKDELMRAVWADSFVEEGNLVFTIGLLRKVLHDDAQKPRFIETVPRRGYRFIAEVRKNPEAALPAARDKKKNTALPRPKPYVLITVSAILMLSLLAAAFVWFRGEQTDSAGRTTNRLTTSGKVTIAAITPDGQTLVFAQKEGPGQSLWRREIATESQAQILPSEAVEFVGLSISPAGDYAYYSVFTKNAVTLTLSRVSLNGGAPESLSEIASDVSVSFSPDGKQFAYTEAHSAVRETLLRTANADGSQLKTLLKLKGEKRAFPVFRASPVAWSPDGGEIACAVQEIEKDKTFFKILLVNPEDKSEKYLSEQRWDFVESIVWKDNENLAITNLEPNLPGRQIWLISRKTGDARQLNHNLKEYEWLSAAKGKLFAVERNTYSALRIADFAENLTKAQTKQIFNEPGVIENIDWSKDDKIFYNSWASGRNEIWQIDPDGTRPKQLTNNSNLTLGFTVSPVDGTLVFTATQNRADSLFIAEADGQNIRQLTFGVFDSHPRFMPDGKEVIFQQGSLIKPTVWRVSTGNNQPPKQLTGYLARQPAPRPDGKTIAYQFMDFNTDNKLWRLGLMDSANGRLLNVIDFPYLITERNVVWRPGDHLLTMVVTSGENSGFLLLSPTNNSYQTIENVTNDKISAFVWSPDGKRLAFTAHQVVSDAVLLDAF